MGKVYVVVERGGYDATDDAYAVFTAPEAAELACLACPVGGAEVQELELDAPCAPDGQSWIAAAVRGARGRLVDWVRGFDLAQAKSSGNPLDVARHEAEDAFLRAFIDQHTLEGLDDGE